MPPYWHLHHAFDHAALTDAALHGPIRLEDHTEDSSEQSRALWAKHVSVDDYVIVSGAVPGGEYVVWCITVETLKVRYIHLPPRYPAFSL